MQLLLIRHAIAEDREEYTRHGDDDDERPLTPFGRQRMKRNARGLRRVQPVISLIGSSPLVRARQTADIVAAEYGIASIHTVDAMRPTAPPGDFTSWLQEQPRDAECIAVVGHDPHVGTLVTWLLSGVEQPRVLFKKGGAVLLDFRGTAAAGTATLLWALPPAQLRRLGE